MASSSLSSSAPPSSSRSSAHLLRTLPLLLHLHRSPLLRPSPPRPSRPLRAPPLKALAKRSDGASFGIDPRAGVAVYKPRSYGVLVADASRALVYALDDGKTRLEIEFPPLPSNISSYKGSSDEFIDANTQLALAIVRNLQERKGIRSCIVFPDQPEKRRASQLFRTALETIGDVTIGSLDDIPGGPVSNFFKSVRRTLDFDFADENEESTARFTLGETKEELLRVLGLQEEQGSSLEFLRRGYKTATWWEEDTDLEFSSAWRS